MHDEPRSDRERHALDAWRPTEPPPGFADRVLAAAREPARPKLPSLGRLAAPLGLRVAGLVLAAAALAGAAWAAVDWVSSRTGSVRPGPAVTVPRAETMQSAALPAEAPEDPGVAIPADLAERVDRYVAGHGQRYGDAFKFQGIVVVLKDGDPVFSRAYGPADRGTGAPITDATRFKIGSLTQIFTAVAVLQLRDQGKLDLDAPVRKYLPDYPASGARITVRQLLSHTSGIPSYTDAALFSVGHAGPVKPAEVRALFQDLPLEFTPGSEFDLSNSGYFLLGQIVEAVARQPFAAYLEANVLAPAGMKDSGLALPVDTIGYEFDEDEVLMPADPRHPTAYGAAGAMVSTAADLARWDRALRVPGLILAQQSLDEMTREVRDDYGLGWFLRRERGQTMAFHPGGVEGYNATIARYLGDGVTVFALANTEAVDTRALVYDIAQIAHGDDVEPPVEHVEVGLGAGSFPRFVGTYTLTEHTRGALGPLVGADQLEALERVRVYDNHGRLFMRVPDYGSKWMHALGGDRFFFKDPAGTVAEFGPPGAPVAHLTLRQGELQFVLRRETAARPAPAPERKDRATVRALPPRI